MNQVRAVLRRSHQGLGHATARHTGLELAQEGGLPARVGCPIEQVIVEGAHPARVRAAVVREVFIAGDHADQESFIG